MLARISPSARKLLFFFGSAVALAVSAIFALADEPPAKSQSIEPRWIHLRNDPIREWSSFPATPNAAELEVHFNAAKNPAEYALRLRQQDVKQSWRVLLNGKPLGDLTRDEADLVIYLPVAPGALVAGENALRIEPTARGAKAADDIRVGQITLEPRSTEAALQEATLEIEVFDAATNQPLPARITIADANGSRHSVGAVSSDELAVRPGVIYARAGKARCGVPAGKYTVYAGRGFEYSLAQVETTLTPGAVARHTLVIRREVPTPGYIACDTHIHTLTHSGHGDATIAERMLTLAGEGIELPIATDHNAHIDYEAEAQRLGVRQHFTPVIGNEVTTTVGHFNIWPVQPGAAVPDHLPKDWSQIFDGIFATPGVKVAILNHARDVHSGVRPFGPEQFNAASGDNVAGWQMRFNGMEVTNSGATQTDPLLLAGDWMTLLNRGYQVTPVGSSDSHDVARYIVGQGRTYIRCDDRDLARLDVKAAVESFLQGRVLVSYGLIADLTINGKHGSGDLASPIGDEIEVAVRVLGPHWVQATKVQLYANGLLLREEAIPRGAGSKQPGGVKWQATWKLPRPAHDQHLVAVAMGEGIDEPYWPTARPYQPTSTDWQPHTLGISGAVWVDGDGDGRRSPAREYAERMFAETGGDLSKLAQALQPFDAAVSTHAAQLYRTGGENLRGEEYERIMKSAPPHVAAGFQTYWLAWRDNELARASRE